MNQRLTTMNKPLILILITFLSLKGYSQINFEPGYFIDSTNTKIDCLIKNSDWLNNPTEFDYKLSENGNTLNGSIKTTVEFGVYNTFKYIRRTVNIDMSNIELDVLSTVKNPEFTEQEIFLKVLLEGKANLFFFKQDNLNRFFYSSNTNSVEQLVFKKFKVNEHKVATNNMYRNQLWNDLKCITVTKNDIEKIKYNKADLLKIFLKYNQCQNTEVVQFENSQKRDLFNLNIRPGISSTSLNVSTIYSNQNNINFGSQTSFRFGIEAEFIMPFNKNKWSVFVEPTYNSFNSEIIRSIRNITAEYSSIEVPIGIRHYFFLNEKSKFFVNAAYTFDAFTNSSIKVNSSIDLESIVGYGVSFGIGYKYRDGLSVELRYQTKGVSNDVISFNSKYQSTSIIIGYSLF